MRGTGRARSTSCCGASPSTTISKARSAAAPSTSPPSLAGESSSYDVHYVVPLAALEDPENASEFVDLFMDAHRVLLGPPRARAISHAVDVETPTHAR
jgi:hypothetical protein